MNRECGWACVYICVYELYGKTNYSRNWMQTMGRKNPDKRCALHISLSLFLLNLYIASLFLLLSLLLILTHFLMKSLLLFSLTESITTKCSHFASISIKWFMGEVDKDVCTFYHNTHNLLLSTTKAKDDSDYSWENYFVVGRSSTLSLYACVCVCVCVEDFQSVVFQLLK